MKRLCFYLTVFISAFLIGIFVMPVSRDSGNLRPENDLFSIDDEEMRSATIVDISIKPPRFTETFKACGRGYVQGYVSDDGFKLSEGNIGCGEDSGPTENEPGNSERRSRHVIKRTGDRIVSELTSDGMSTYEIRTDNTGGCHYIQAPSLGLALELEEFLKANNQ